MAFEIKALVGKKVVLAELAHRFKAGRVSPLCGEIGLIPLNEALEKEIGPDVARPFKDLAIPESLSKLAAEESVSGPVAYIEALYGKGKNHQGCVIYVDGKIEKGPLVDKSIWDPRESGLQDRPVDQALRAVGVVADASTESDEWDVSGLNRHHQTEDWK